MGPKTTEDASQCVSAERCKKAIASATQYAASVMKSDGHWSGEVHSNVTITAEYVFLLCYLQLDLEPHREALVLFLRHQQQRDGSWGIAFEHPGDVSTSSEAYLALKILGVDADSPMMLAAKDFILAQGGVAKVRFFTRIYFAMFGLLPWDAVPQLPPELILVPSYMPGNIYRFSSWARATLVPLLVIAYHRPTFALPNGSSSSNDFLDEIWHQPGQKTVPYTPPISTMFLDQNWIGLGATVVDGLLYYQNRLGFPPFTRLRKYAVQKCMSWIMERQETSGDIAGIFPPLHATIIAMHLEGVKMDDMRRVRAFEAVERFTVQDRRGKRVQPCVSPCWDTALMAVGLLDSCSAGDGQAAEVKPMIDSALQWFQAHQHLRPVGDWRVYRPHTVPGGFAFEYHNSWYPDVDDTQTVIAAFFKADPSFITSDCVVAAIGWILGMQCSDGGWAGFDYNNNHLYLNRIPFSDMEAFCDPATADVTGGVVETFGMIIRASSRKNLEKSGMVDLLGRMGDACDRALKFLVGEQETDGSWYGRWGCNYLYGTSNVLCGLEYFHGHEGYDFLNETVARGVSFLLRWQNADGGWGESALSYIKSPVQSTSDKAKAVESRQFARCESTASQTAWAVMALLAYLPAHHDSIVKGIAYLLDSQTDDGYDVTLENGQEMKGYSWPEPQYTATGFPGSMMLKYEYYRHYFPMMAIGRFLAKGR
ncbi:terpenoid cyclases/protein prenyltransferase alpha-alpha toroid [Xylaria flabelliformis]|nr:terpenoid cyclases/protein prenyltransferase alpha-alpha toroid [Xylaria flabelliformis]